MSESENGFSAPLVEELAPLFPSYKILTLIAKGGMGAVYHAVQTSLDREVAIKILPAELSDDREFCEGFETEAKAMAKLNHPNLIGVFDFGEVEGMLFTVMEYVPGDSLHDACHGSAIEPSEVVRLMAGVARGLDHAHKHGILHRDIKPANILLDDELEPKIGDFGLARSVDALFQEGETIFGTPGYTAPEVVECPYSVDQRADIFSLGVLLHELLTGQLPVGDSNPPSAISQCDPRFDAVVSKASCPNPDGRYQNASEIADELEKIANSAGPRLLQSGSTAASRPQVPQGYSMPATKKGNGGLIAAIILLAVVATVFFLRDKIFQGPEGKPAPAPVVDQTPEPEKPEPELVSPAPEPVEPEPEPVVAQPQPVAPDPEPVVEHDPEPAAPDPEPVAAQPKFDVPAFLVHARSVMFERCGPDIMKRDEALLKNLADFKTEAWRQTLRNLDEKWHDEAERQLGEFVNTCKQNGNRMGDSLVKPLKFKAWLVAEHKERLEKEGEIDQAMMHAFTKHEKTYVYGLGLKLKACQKDDDPGAVKLIQTELDKVAASKDYFVGMMLEASRDPETLKREPVPADAHDPERMIPEPEPVAGSAKSDVQVYIAHARSVMAERCGPDIAKRDQALEKNLTDFKSSALKMLYENLDEKWHTAADKELNAFVSGCMQNDNRMGMTFETPLKNKKYLVPLYKAHQLKEAEIEKELKTTFGKHEKTYLQGLGVKLKALQKANDTEAAEVINAEIDKVTEGVDYFSNLMHTAQKGS